MLAVLITLPGDLKRSPGRHASRAVVSYTARLVGRFALMTVDSNFPEISYWALTRMSRYGVLQYLPLVNIRPRMWFNSQDQMTWATNNSINLQKLNHHAKF